MKGIQIYKTQKHIKIVTMYQIESEAYITSEPVFVFSLDEDISKIKDNIFLALDSSRKISEKEEDTFWLGNTILKKMNETSFQKLYVSSKSCMVFLEKNNIKIIPMKYAGKGQGLSEDIGVIEMSFNSSDKEKITLIILDFLNSGSV